MSDAATDELATPSKSTKPSMIIGIILAITGAGAGFVAVQMGAVSMILSPDPQIEHADGVAGEANGMIEVRDLPMHDTSDIAFVEIDPIMISLAGDGQIQNLRFRAQLEVNEADQSDVIKLLPRVVDVLNSYLRALEVSDLRDPLALTRLRGQMLRRVQIVIGHHRVRDLLIMDFVLN